MDLIHRFRVPATVEETWRAFNHLDRLAPCFPGAAIASAEGDEFSGLVKVKLGPLALVYAGAGRYLERDAEGRRVVFQAEGADRRGHGTATARVTATFVGDDDGTDVELLTDLALTGRPAQFGPDVVADVGDKLLDQFVSCVRGRFATGLGAATGDEPEVPLAAPAPDELWEEWAAAPDRPVETADSEPTVEIEPVAAEEPAPTSEETLAATPPLSAEISGPPQPFRYTPPSNQSRPATDVARSMLLGTVRRWGPPLGFVLLAVAVVVRLLGRRR